jgi:hypothetical protein
MKRLKKTPIIIVTALLLGAFAVSSLVFPASAVAPTPLGHWVDNLGPGVTAAEFAVGNRQPECEQPGFTGSESDLWVFEVSGATDSTSIPVWDASVPAWTSNTAIVVRDVTSEFGAYRPDTATKRLYIESSPPGARLNAAHLLYSGDSTSEILLFTCSHKLNVMLKGDLVPSYDLSYRWTIDTDVQWKAAAAYTYDISYSATRQRADRPEIQPGSVHVRGSLEFGEPNLEILSAEISYLSGNARQNCLVDSTTLNFDCSIDESLLTVDPDTGQPIDVGSITITVVTPFGPVMRTFSVDWRSVAPTNIFRTSAVIRNHAAMVAHTEVTVSKYSTINFFQETWSPGSNYCSTRYQVFDLIAEPSTTATPEDQTTTAVTWCRPRPGYSLQYFGGPYGIPMLIANVGSLQQMYPSALAGLPALTNRDQVRDFLASISCLESCKALFRAQFLTAAFNALDPAFAQQTILIGERCLTIAQYLQEVDAESPRLDKTTTVIRKAELERINGAFVTTCPTVATSTNSPSPTSAS